MAPVPAETPTVTSYCNYLYDIASLIPQLQGAMASAKTLYTKYEQVLAYDEKMRQLATAYMPTFLSANSPVPSTLPVYVPWARRSLAIYAAHKIITIHRKFLGISFFNSAFTFTRRTCIAASKTILKEAQTATDKNGPLIWTDQAFVVAAGIVLSLDAFHRKSDEPEYAEHRNLTEEAIEYPHKFNLSMIASSGIKLLSFLVNEMDMSQDNGLTAGSRKRPCLENVEEHRLVKRPRVFNISSFMHSISAGPAATPRVDVTAESNADIAWDFFAGMFPPQTGFGDHLFDSFFRFEA